MFESLEPLFICGPGLCKIKASGQHPDHRRGHPSPRLHFGGEASTASGDLDRQPARIAWLRLAHFPKIRRAKGLLGPQEPVIAGFVQATQDPHWPAPPP